MGLEEAISIFTTFVLMNLRFLFKISFPIYCDAEFHVNNFWISIISELLPNVSMCIIFFRTWVTDGCEALQQAVCRVFGPGSLWNYVNFCCDVLTKKASVESIEENVVLARCASHQLHNYWTFLSTPLLQPVAGVSGTLCSVFINSFRSWLQFRCGIHVAIAN